MVDLESGLSVVFNGCLYNYRELRAELQRLGHRFFSTSDTEVLLRAYAEWGTECVDHFLGMFAFAVAERDSGRTVLGRDRLGINLCTSITHRRGCASRPPCPPSWLPVESIRASTRSPSSST